MAKKEKKETAAHEQAESVIGGLAGPVSASGTARPAVPLRLPNNVKAVPLDPFDQTSLAPRTSELTSVTSATIPTIAAVTSRPTQSLIAAKTGRQASAGPRVFGPGQRVAFRVTRF
jgi:hypothetical protein